MLDASTSPPKGAICRVHGNIIADSGQETSRYCRSADGSLAKVMKALLSQPQARWPAGDRPSCGHDPALAAKSVANFHETLRAGSRLGMISRLRQSPWDWRKDK